MTKKQLTPRIKKSGLPKGVVLNKKRYAATLSIDSRKFYLGTFSTPELAEVAYKLAAASGGYGYKSRPAQYRPTRADGAELPLRSKTDKEPFTPTLPPNSLWKTQWITQAQ